ncbi:MAG: type I DNA topoisomerase [Planctomycetes bacterium]|nr:type I DNA topoisomerase [Planctomycetota bacterium]
MAKRDTAGKALVIVESPAKAKTINKYLGSDFVVKASMGHVRDLPQRELGIDVSDDFKPTYEVVPGRTKVVGELKKIAAKASHVYLATDRDREGEAIAWHLIEALNLPAGKVKRVVFNEITKTAITEAFANAHEIDIDRVNAQQARRILDRIVGYELSPLLWEKIAKGLSAGRVQSVAARLIVEREIEIREFVPVEGWKIAGYFAGDPSATSSLADPWRKFREGERTQKDIRKWLSDQGCFRTELVELRGKSFDAADAEAASAVAQALGYRVERVQRSPHEEYKHLKLENAVLVGEFDPQAAPSAVVSELKTKRTITRPSAPFTTASLQQQASTALRFSASRTMRVAQGLYEGIDLSGDGPVGLITYMRTDSTNLAREAVAAARGFVQQSFGDRYLPEKPNVYGKRQARTQEAHEAIRPTDPSRTPESMRKALSNEQYRLYELIWKRFIACQMAPAQWDSTSLSVSCETKLGPARFATSGRKLVFDGFLKVAGLSSEDPILPALQQGKPVGTLDIEPRQHFTPPPPRFTEASLVKELESAGIGRPSTYAAIIDTIQKRGYVEQVDRKFHATALGELVTEKLVQHFPKIMDLKFTSYMEDELDKIEESHLDWVHVLHEFYDPFKELLEQAGEAMQAERGQPSEYKCPDCDAELLYRWSKTGRFLGCSKYPDCKTTRNVNRAGEPIEPTVSEHMCELCDKPMVVRRSRTGPFLGCSGYPDCRHTIACDETGEPLRLVTEDELKRPCDACGEGTMTVKRKGRRSFLGCDGYPKCKNTTPLPSDVRLKSKPEPPPEPAGLDCDKCGRPMVIRTGSRGKFIACPGFPKCRNAKPFEKLEELKAAAAAKGNGKKSKGGDGGDSPKAAAKARKALPAADPKNDPPPPGYAWTRTGRPVVETMPSSEGDLHCPECGQEMVLRRGRFGPFFSCTGFPRCKFVSNLRGEAKKQAEELMPAPARPKPEPTDIPCEECGKPMWIRQSRRGKFLGCSGYPKCKSTQELPAGVAGQ